MYKFEELREILLTIDKSSITEVELEKDGMKVSIRKPEPPYISPNRYMHQVVTPPQPPPTEQRPTTMEISDSKGVSKEYSASEVKVPEKREQFIVSSRFVGAFGKLAAKKVGDNVKKGEVLGTVESFNIPNEILSDVDGTIIEVLVKENQLIEYGQHLVVIQLA